MPLSRHIHLYRTRRWRDLRIGHLKMQRIDGRWVSTALCVMCDSVGDATIATVLDHIVPHRGDEAAFHDESNLQPLCQRCHGIKGRHEMYPDYYPDSIDAF